MTSTTETKAEKNEIATQSQAINLSVGSLPNLEEAEESVISLMPEYLDIDDLDKGYNMRCFYLGVIEREQVDKETGDIKSLKCVMLAEQKGENIKVWETAATQLVKVLEQKEIAGIITKNETALSVTYLGKKKNKTNSFSSAKWDVRFLTPKAA